MQVEETPLQGCFIIRNQLFADNRGYFFESFNQERFAKATGWQGQFVQDNQSESARGVVRGIHFQQGQWAQAKLVRVLHGRVLDVAVDLRPQSPTFGQWYAVELSDDNATQLFVPRGFGHGFAVLSEKATFFYKCDNYYNKASESGIHPYDTELVIDWQIPEAQAVLSDKDLHAASFASFKASLPQ